MSFIADLHIHSHYSLATSQELKPDFLDLWARIKGIGVIGTGDFTHPGWIKELKDMLTMDETGLYSLRKELVIDARRLGFNPPDASVRFLLTAEISNIYKHKGKVRKVHNILLAPDFEVVDKIIQQMQRHKFNITSDGRPILGMDSRDFFEMCLSVSDSVCLVPAHIWTPWFSVLGDKSGFDHIEECYGNLTSNIFAVEMGLSSDPPMNWLVSQLDRFTLIANSDAHSPEKLGRNANIFHCAPSYSAIIEALKGNGSFGGTISFFPQEGKYHYDGHRKCNICWSPLETLRHKGICPVCGNKITIGVMNRVAQLADRDNIYSRPNRAPAFSLIPLKELLAEILDKSESAKPVARIYQQILQKAGTELNLLLHWPMVEVARCCDPLLTEAIRRMRNRNVLIREGFDGEYGEVKVFSPDEKINSSLSPKSNPPDPRPLFSFDIAEYRRLSSAMPVTATESITVVHGLNPLQQAAVNHPAGPMLVIAGPGTGKTHVLTQRILWLIRQQNADPQTIIAITFTNKAANEIRQRLANNNDYAATTNVFTFHSFGLKIIRENIHLTGRENGFTIIDEDEQTAAISNLINNTDKSTAASIAQQISWLKQQPGTPMPQIAEAFEKYNLWLKQNNLFDIDDLVYEASLLLNNNPEILQKYRQQIHYMLIDEYQDINLSQYQLVRQIMHTPDAGLCVIGDPDQAIYGFRGSDNKYILQFTADYPGAAVFHLSQSYRCSDRILAASGEVLNKKQNQQLHGLHKGLKIQFSDHPSADHEAEYIANTIEKMMGGLRFLSIDSRSVPGEKANDISSLSDFAVLCRTRLQFDAIEKAFNRIGIPCRIVDGKSFYAKPFVRNIIDLLRYMIKGHRPYRMKKLPDRQKLIRDTQGMTTGQIIAFLADSMAQPENKDDLKQLIAMAADFESDIQGMIDTILLGTEADLFKPEIENVSVMTIHASKGLEFKCVFIPGCEDGLLPFSLFKNRITDIGEERRLLYVAMTRAEKYLYLSRAKIRNIAGQILQLQQSPFLRTIKKDLMDIYNQEAKKNATPDNSQLKLF